MTRTALLTLSAAAVFTLANLAHADCGKDDCGFTPLFDGKTLNGWDGNPKLWSIEDGAIHGSTQPDGLQEANTFLIWRGSEPADFELKVKFKLLGGNSGIQYRSQDLGGWHVGGYQAEVRNGANWPGYMYHERGGRGRGRVSMVGEHTTVAEDNSKTKKQVGNAEELMREAKFKPGEWSEMHIVARGNHVIHKLNGVTVTEYVDNSATDRCEKGIIALQMHRGGPMDVYFKDILLKEIKE